MRMSCAFGSQSLSLLSTRSSVKRPEFCRAKSSRHLLLRAACFSELRYFWLKYCWMSWKLILIQAKPDVDESQQSQLPERCAFRSSALSRIFPWHG